MPMRSNLQRCLAQSVMTFECLYECFVSDEEGWPCYVRLLLFWQRQLRSACWRLVWRKRAEAVVATALAAAAILAVASTAVVSVAAALGAVSAMALAGSD